MASSKTTLVLLFGVTILLLIDFLPSVSSLEDKESFENYKIIFKDRKEVKRGDISIESDDNSNNSMNIPELFVRRRRRNITNSLPFFREQVKNVLNFAKEREHFLDVFSKKMEKMLSDHFSKFDSFLENTENHIKDIFQHIKNKEDFITKRLEDNIIENELKLNKIYTKLSNFDMGNIEKAIESRFEFFQKQTILPLLEDQSNSLVKLVDVVNLSEDTKRSFSDLYSGFSTLLEAVRENDKKLDERFNRNFSDNLENFHKFFKKISEIECSIKEKEKTTNSSLPIIVEDANNNNNISSFVTLGYAEEGKKENDTKFDKIEQF